MLRGHVECIAHSTIMVVLKAMMEAVALGAWNAAYLVERVTQCRGQ